MISKETSTVFFGKDSSKTPFVTLKGSNFEDIDDKDISRLSSINPNWAAQNVNNLEIDVSNILGIIIIFNLPICPVFALNTKDIAWIN